MNELQKVSWPVEKAGEALEALARESGLKPRPSKITSPSQDLAGDSAALNLWIESVSIRLGVEAEPAQATYTEVEDLVRGAGPALLLIPDADGPRLLAVLKCKRSFVFALGPDLSTRRLAVETGCSALRRELEAPLLTEVDRMLSEAGIPRRRRTKAHTAILSERLGARYIQAGWLLRPSPGAGLRAQARSAGLFKHLLTFVGAHAIQYGLWLLSWGLIGRGALEGRLEWGWLAAWALLLVTLLPLRLLATQAQGWLSIGVGGVLKRRLLYGALRLEPDEISNQGSGQLLGRVIESEAVEMLALKGGLLGLTAAIELIAAAVVLGAGVGGAAQVMALLGWAALAGCVAWVYYQRRGRWTEARLQMTHELVERMVGHRTRLAQESPEHWHDGEDQAVARALELAQEMDRVRTLLETFLSRGWLVIGFLALTPVFVAGGGSVAALAIALGGTLLAYRAFKKLGAGLWSLIGAAIAWRRVSPIFCAAARPENRGALAMLAPAAGRLDEGQPVFEARELIFRYRAQGEPVLRGCSLHVNAGGRLLLEGSSGAGKSTLAALLIGARQPESGLLLLNGLDWQTLGVGGWRRQVAAVPQFHENYVLTETFAFNLLMGRCWPPKPGDMEEALAVCRELGLGNLLGRMPAGLLQMVGEGGWQLSHGERNRLYIARALLQGTEVVILDESFAALDAETLSQALRCVLRRARTLLLIAYP